MPTKKTPSLITERKAREIVRDLKKLEAYRNGVYVDPNNVDTKLVAQLFGLSRTRISQLHSEGVIRNNGTRGRYVLAKVVVAYLAYLKKSKRSTVRERLINQQERKLKLHNDALADTLVDMNEAADALLRFCRLWRTGAEALPKNIAGRIAKTKNKKEIRDILNEAFAALIPEIQTPIDEFVRDAKTR